MRGPCPGLDRPGATSGEHHGRGESHCQQGQREQRETDGRHEDAGLHIGTDQAQQESTVGGEQREAKQHCRGRDNADGKAL
jgi:hypothetical protein